MNIESFFCDRVILPEVFCKNDIIISAWFIIVMNQFLVTRLYISITGTNNLFLMETFDNKNIKRRGETQDKHSRKLL